MTALSKSAHRIHTSVLEKKNKIQNLCLFLWPVITVIGLLLVTCSTALYSLLLSILGENFSRRYLFIYLFISDCVFQKIEFDIRRQFAWNAKFSFLGKKSICRLLKILASILSIKDYTVMFLLHCRFDIKSSSSLFCNELSRIIGF